MTTKNIQDVVAEFDERWQTFEKALKESGNRDWLIILKLYPVLKVDHKETRDWLTTTLTQLVKEVEEGERERILKQAPSMPLKNKEYVQGFVDCNEGWIQALTPATNDEAEEG